MQIISIIQARKGSTRLPGKVLLRLEGATVLEHVINRVSRSKLLNEVVVATSIEKEDIDIVKICADNYIRVFCGSEEDVLDRYYQAAKLLHADQIVRITADCPLIDPNIIDRLINEHISHRMDYTTNTLEPTFPDGEDVEILSFKTLKKIWTKAKLPSDREHVTPYIRKHQRMFKILNIRNATDLSSKRWTLDQEEDFQFISQIYSNLYKKNPHFSMNDILDFVTLHPYLEDLNKNIHRNEGYMRSLKEDKKYSYDKRSKSL